MTKIGIDSSNSVNYPDKNTLAKPKNLTDNNSLLVPDVYPKDIPYNSKKTIVSENPFGKPVSSTHNNPLKDALKLARENKDSKGLFDIAKIQYEKNTLPNIKASDLFREAYETALSEMDSDTLYEIGNFEASYILLPDVSSEFIFKMADMTRKIY